MHVIQESAESSLLEEWLDITAHCDRWVRKCRLISEVNENANSFNKSVLCAADVELPQEVSEEHVSDVKRTVYREDCRGRERPVESYEMHETFRY